MDKYERLWYECKTFHQVKAVNCLFIEGLVSCSPYHCGPLEPESDQIIDVLRSINSMNWITYDSQPYLQFRRRGTKEYTKQELLSSEEDKDSQQHSYLCFFIPLDQVVKLMELISEYDIYCVIRIDQRPGGGSPLFLGDLDKPFCLESNLDPGVTSDEYLRKVKTLGHFLNDYSDSGFGSVFGDFLQEIEPDVASVIVTSTRKDNTMFDELRDICYKLYQPSS